MMQIWITAIIVFVAVGYALWRIGKAVRDRKSPCDDCPMKKNCQKFGQSKEK
jgi:hypothetical protein